MSYTLCYIEIIEIRVLWLLGIASKCLGMLSLLKLRGSLVDYVTPVPFLPDGIEPVLLQREISDRAG